MNSELRLALIYEEVYLIALQINTQILTQVTKDKEVDLTIHTCLSIEKPEYRAEDCLKRNNIMF